MPTMFIVRGVPGSGKSTLADMLAERTENCVVCEADDYFYDEDNNYNYNGDLIGEAHEWCWNKAYKGCFENKNVIVSNTAALEKHVNKYIALAEEFGYNIQIITLQSTFKNNKNLSQEVLDKFDRRFCYKRFDIGCGNDDE